MPTRKELTDAIEDAIAALTPQADSVSIVSEDALNRAFIEARQSNDWLPQLPQKGRSHNYPLKNITLVLQALNPETHPVLRRHGLTQQMLDATLKLLTPTKG